MQILGASHPSTKTRLTFSAQKLGVSNHARPSVKSRLTFPAQSLGAFEGAWSSSTPKPMFATSKLEAPDSASLKPKLRREMRASTSQCSNNKGSNQIPQILRRRTNIHDRLGARIDPCPSQPRSLTVLAPSIVHKKIRVTATPFEQDEEATVYMITIHVDYAGEEDSPDKPTNPNVCAVGKDGDEAIDEGEGEGLVGSNDPLPHLKNKGKATASLTNEGVWMILSKAIIIML